MEKTTYWYRVKYGYKVGEHISIPESHLAKAIYAMQKQILFAFNDKFINGKEIKTITPDYHKHTGWNEWYDPTTADDFLQIERDCPDYDGRIEIATKLALESLRTGRIDVLSTPLQNNLLEK